MLHHLFRLISTVSAAFTFSQHFSTKPFSKIPWRYRNKAIKDSQKALTEYLHTTRSLPYLYAEHIATNSPKSLSKILSEIPFSPSNFITSFHRFLRYHPVNELDFFLESIGLNCDKNVTFFPKNTFFISDWNQFNVVCALAGLGFPWRKLGLLCKDEKLVFGFEVDELGKRVGRVKEFYGFNSVCVIGICLAFPRVLYDGDEDDGRVEGLLSDLKVLFVDCDLVSETECGDVDGVLGVCEKVRVFYDLGCEMGKIGELLGRSKRVFIEYTKEYLVSKIEYFCELNVEKDRVGIFLLSCPEVFGFDLDSRVISVSGFLKHFGMGRDELESLVEKFPHAFGRNRIANLPRIMRLMDLNNWFFEKLKNGDHLLLNTYAMDRVDEDLDKSYIDGLRKIQATRTYAHVLQKLDFFHSIGFGENMYTIKALRASHSSGSNLQQRFDCLLKCGIEYSKLCAMIRLSSNILNQEDSAIEKKLEFLCNELGSSLDCLNVFPAYLCYDLEGRIRPRYELHKWLMEMGFCKKEYSVSTIVASSEKTFVARISRMHPDAAKKWQEDALRRKGGGKSCTENLVP